MFKPKNEKSLEELMLEVAMEMGGGVVEQKREAMVGASEAAVFSAFPALNNNLGNPLPPPAPDRDRDGYDRNNWSRLLRQARDTEQPREIVEYLEVLRQTGMGLELRPVRVSAAPGSGKKTVTIERFVFTTGQNVGWTEGRIKDVVQSLYTYMAFLPAWKAWEGTGRSEGKEGEAVLAMEAAIRAGGLLGATERGLRFDWSRAADRNEVERARSMMSGARSEIMGYIRQAERGFREINLVMGLAEMSDCVD